VCVCTDCALHAQEVKHKEDMQKLVRTISHEIRNPLHGILANTQALLDLIKEAEEMTEVARRSSSAVRLCSSTDDVLQELEPQHSAAVAAPAAAAAAAVHTASAAELLSCSSNSSSLSSITAATAVVGGVCTHCGSTVLPPVAAASAAAAAAVAAVTAPRTSSSSSSTSSASTVLRCVTSSRSSSGSLSPTCSGASHMKLALRSNSIPAGVKLNDSSSSSGISSRRRAQRAE
jgi:His Kinase A (phospho-acceptor) domain